MQSSHTTITLAGEQIPLLSEEQLQSGMLLTGVALSHVWEILEKNAVYVMMRKAQAAQQGVCTEPHIMGAFGRGYTCSVCSVRKQEIKDLLPFKTGKARVHVIIPRDGRVRVPQSSTVYGGLFGTELKLYHLNNSMWNEPLPLYPELYKVWEVPEALRSLNLARVDVDQSEVDIPF